MAEAVLKQILDQLQLLQEGQTGLRQEMSGIKQDVSSLKQDVSDLKQEVTSLKQDVSDLKQEVTSLKQDVSSMKQDIEVLKAGQAELKEITLALKHSSEVTIARLDALTAEVRQFKSDVMEDRNTFEHSLNILNRRQFTLETEFEKLKNR